VKRSLHIVVLAVLALMFLGPIPKSLAGPPATHLRTADATALDALGVTPSDAAAYGTGAILHADALRQGPHSLLDLDVAFSGSAFSSAVPSKAYTNEVSRLVTPKLAANASHGRGSALELGIGSDPIPLIGQLSETSAPPSTGLIEKVIGPLGVPGVLTADLLRSQSQSRASDGCVLGRDQSYGLGSVLNLNVLDGLLVTAARPPMREVSQSATTTRLVPGTEGGRLGLKSETRQTIAPVTFFRGTPAQFTVEVLGEWALRAVADGAKGSVSYGPLTTSPETPVLRVLGDHGQVVGQLTTQELLGPKGLTIAIPGVAEIVLGEAPRAIGGATGSSPVVQPTQAAAAADVVRVRLLGGTAADVRLGHMEAAVTVPAGGVQCPGVNVVQTVDKPTVTPGENFVYTIDVTNPNDCDLTHLKVIETIGVSPAAEKPAAAQFTVVSTTPPDDLAGGVATWPDLGVLGAGETKTLTVKITVPLDSPPGKLKALAVASGLCPALPHPTVDLHPIIRGPNTSTPDDIPVGGQGGVEGPTIGVCVVPDVLHKTPAVARTLIEAAGCKLGTVTDIGKPPNPADIGKIVNQGPPAGQNVPLGTPVNVDVGGPVCIVPSLSGKTPDAASGLLATANCKLGTVTTGPTTPNPDDAGKITTQNPPAGDTKPPGSPVDVTIAPAIGYSTAAAVQACTVPNVMGLTEADARGKVEAAGCVLTTDTRATSNPAEVGKVLSQSPATGTVLAKGSPVNVTLGVQVLGAALRPQQSAAGGTGPAPTLARTGGVALAGLALWLLVSGLLSNVAGSERLWRLARRQKG